MVDAGLGGGVISVEIRDGGFEEAGIGECLFEVGGEQADGIEFGGGESSAVAVESEHEAAVGVAEFERHAIDDAFVAEDFAVHRVLVPLAAGEHAGDDVDRVAGLGFHLPEGFGCHVAAVADGVEERAAGKRRVEVHLEDRAAHGVVAGDASVFAIDDAGDLLDEKLDEPLAAAECVEIVEEIEEMFFPMRWHFKNLAKSGGAGYPLIGGHGDRSPRAIGGGGAIINAEFSEDAFEVGFDGFWGDGEEGCNFRVGFACGGPAEDFVFLFTEWLAEHFAGAGGEAVEQAVAAVQPIALELEHRGAAAVADPEFGGGVGAAVELVGGRGEPAVEPSEPVAGVAEQVVEFLAVDGVVPRAVEGDREDRDVGGSGLVWCIPV